MQSLNHQFLDFCRSKPRDEKFDYADKVNCAWGQFCNAAGIPWDDDFPPSSIDRIINPLDDVDFILDEDCMATFGALADKLDKALAA